MRLYDVGIPYGVSISYERLDSGVIPYGPTGRLDVPHCMNFFRKVIY